MNKEEAITALGDRNNLLWGMSKEEQKYYSEALDMAISALSENKTPLGEYISKADMERILYSTNNAVRIGEEFLELPTYSFPDFKNKSEWILVSEMLPEDDTEVVYCTEMGTVGSCHYFEGFNHYKGCSREDIFDDIVAWFPIPEVPLEKDWWNTPYQKGGE